MTLNEPADDDQDDELGSTIQPYHTQQEGAVPWDRSVALTPPGGLRGSSFDDEMPRNDIASMKLWRRPAATSTLSCTAGSTSGAAAPCRRSR